MVTLVAKVAWIRNGGRRLAVGETFEVESERHARPLLARGDAERAEATPPAGNLPPPGSPDIVKDSAPEALIPDLAPVVEPPAPVKPAARKRSKG